MEDTSKIELKSRDIFYFRQRYKNRVYENLLKFFVEEAEARGITRKQVATRLGRDPAQVTRWLREPSNLTLDTISDLLLALDAEPDPPLSIQRFEDRAIPNYEHPLISRIRGKPAPGAPAATSGEVKIFVTKPMSPTVESSSDANIVRPKLVTANVY